MVSRSRRRSQRYREGRKSAAPPRSIVVYTRLAEKRCIDEMESVEIKERQRRTRQETLGVYVMV